MSPVDPRLNGLPATQANPYEAQLAAVRQEVADLRREVRDLRAAPTIQVGAGSPAGLPARVGAPYGQTSAALWLCLPTGWRGVSLPLT